MTTTSSSTSAARNAPGPRGRSAEGLLSGGRRPRGSDRQPRRTRSWGLVTLAALLVVGMGLAVAAWGLHSGHKKSVLEVGAPVAKGQVVQRTDLVSVSVAGVPGAIAVADLSQVVGRTAAVDLVQGQILTSSMVTSTPVPRPGQSVVGLSLDPANVPGAGLEAGDQVEVVAVPGGNDDGGQADASDPTSGSSALDAPQLLAKAAQVYAVDGSSTAGGQVLVTLVVDSGDAARVAAYSTQNRVAVVETAPSATPSAISSANTDSGDGPTAGSEGGSAGSSAGGPKSCSCHWHR